MDHDENWGIAFARVTDYFSSLRDVKRISDTSFVFRTAEITLEELPDKLMGSLHFPRTRICITGGADADEIYRRFFYRFLSAGG